MGGIIGLFFFQFGLTVVVAVMISLFVGWTLESDVVLGVGGPRQRASNVCRGWAAS